MAICPTCMTKYAGTETKCPSDGVTLVPDENFAYVDKELVEGDVVGEYRVEGKLGQGGFGAVYRAVHPVIGKHAAIKVLSRQFSSNPQMVSRFIAEARAVNQIRHKNIIDIFAFGQLADGRQYYVMELLDGTPFDKYLAKHTRLTLEQALPILRGVARALDAAHGKGILHRDLKPENVYLFFDEDAGVQAKLLDFGLVKLLAADGSAGGDHKTKTGTPMGTPYYMSPEQCRGKDVDHKTDVYAFGALVFEVLTGRVPFEGESTMDVLMKHITADPPRASEVCLDIPLQLDAPIAQMLAKEAQDRPASVGEALAALVAAGNDAGALTRAAPLPLPSAPGLSYRPAPTVPTMDVVAVPAHTPVRIVSEGADASPHGSTFLASSIEAAPLAAPRSRRLGGLAVLLLGAFVVGALVIGFRPSEKKGDTTPSASVLPASASSVVVVPTPAPSGAAMPSAASKVDEVEVRVEGVPKDAVVQLGGADLGAAPGPFKLERGKAVTLTVVAKGFKSKDVPLTPTASTAVKVVMEKHPPAIGKVAPKGSASQPIDRDLADPGFGPK